MDIPIDSALLDAMIKVQQNRGVGMDNHPCYQPDDEDIMHWETVNTGETGINPISGDQYEIWECPCGIKQTEVYSK